MRLVALGVVPKYRRSGIAELLVLRVIETGMIESGYFGECSMTLENNSPDQSLSGSDRRRIATRPTASTRGASMSSRDVSQVSGSRTLRRVLILADESARWKIAGLRQLDRLAAVVTRIRGDGATGAGNFHLRLLEIGNRFRCPINAASALRLRNDHRRRRSVPRGGNAD